MKRSTMKYAFTLIELLVVIAIIAILAAILFPVFASAREKARQTTCASNLKQLALATIQYVQDYDELPPCGSAGNQGNNQGVTGDNMGVGWAGQIYPYVKSTGVFSCPDAFNVPGVIDGWLLEAWIGFVPGTFNMTYAYNPSLLDTNYAQTGNCCYTYSDMANISKLNSPSMTILFTETMPYPVSTSTPFATETTSALFNGPPSGNWGGNGLAAPATGPLGADGVYPESSWADYGLIAPNMSSGQHSGGANYAFWDGHVKWLHGTSVSPGWDAAVGVGGSAYLSATATETCTSADMGNGGGCTAAGTSGLMLNGKAPAATYSAW